jgi:hypothetical protein
VVSGAVFFMMRGVLNTPSGEPDLVTPQKEAAMFYGLFLRGHPIDRLRRDIDVPRPILEKWMQAHRYGPSFRDALRRVYHYRKTVLAIFDELVTHERGRFRIQ